MSEPTIGEIAALAQKTAPAFLATADSDGRPHIAAVGRISVDSGQRIILDDWLCPQTVENLDANDNACLVIWEYATNNGYQLIGRIVSIHDEAVMDGYSKQLNSQPPGPQIERRLLFEISGIYEFRHGRHSDTTALSGTLP